jgi:CubicO group peptidase (beta-lactamase class C family)
VAVTNGRVLVEYGDVTTVSYIASVRKSVLSMLYGIYVERGVIDLEKTLLQLGIDDIGGLLDIEKQATVRNLLMSRSGCYHPAANGGDSSDKPPRGSKVPGEYFVYNNWDFNALGTIFEQETAQNLYDALLLDIVIPVGMVEFDRSRHRRTGDSSASIHLAYHMYFSTRDMARIGYLMLQNGQWDGTPIVPPDWIELSTLSHTTTSGLGYGYLWWIFGTGYGDRHADGYTGIGYGGQYITVLPAVNLAIAHKTVIDFGGDVDTGDFLDVVDILVDTYCGGPCPGAEP